MNFERTLFDQMAYPDTYHMRSIKNCKSISGDPNCRESGRSFAVGGVGILILSLLRDHVQVVSAVLQVWSSRGKKFRA